MTKKSVEICVKAQAKAIYYCEKKSMTVLIIFVPLYAFLSNIFCIFSAKVHGEHSTYLKSMAQESQQNRSEMLTLTFYPRPFPRSQGNLGGNMLY